jgi:hypothetical protein
VIRAGSTEGARARDRLLALDRPWGADTISLALGDWSLRISGIDHELSRALGRRWGGFVSRGDEGEPTLALRVLRCGEGWLQPQAGEPYRVEAEVADRTPLVRSYTFAAAPEAGRSAWRCGLCDSPREPRERALENLVRYLVSRLAVERGGFALHASGVLREGAAYLFAGASRSGKSTVTALSAPCTSLGDDYAVAVPAASGGWLAPAVPFDNSERAPSGPPGGWFPLAGIWRLHQAAECRVETPGPLAAGASLMACVAFGWALPDLSEALLRQVERFVATGRFVHLHFTKSPAFWQLIRP